MRLVCVQTDTKRTPTRLLRDRRGAAWQPPTYLPPPAFTSHRAAPVVLLNVEAVDRSVHSFHFRALLPPRNLIRQAKP